MAETTKSRNSRPYSIVGGEWLAQHSPYAFLSGSFVDSSYTQLFAEVAIDQGLGKIYTRWKINSYGVLVISPFSLSAKWEWVADTFEIEMIKRGRIKAESVPPNCMCKAIPVREYYLSIATSRSTPFFVKLKRKGASTLRLRISSTDLIINDKFSKQKIIPISRYQGDAVTESLMACDMPICLGN